MKSFGIPGLPPSINTLLNGSIYAAVVDSVPARLSVVIQALKANLAAGNTCVLLTPMTPGVFLARAAASGVDFSEDISSSRLYLFSQEGDYASNIFRYGIKRFLQEFDYFRVPKGSFFLFDQAGDLFTMSDQNMAQTQAMDYRDWMKHADNTALFLFSSSENERNVQSILDYFSGVARIVQNKTELELLIDFWYSQDGAIAAKVLPVILDKSGFIRIEPLMVQAALLRETEANPVDEPARDADCVYYLGPDFKAFSAAIRHNGEWKLAQNLVNLVHLSKDAVLATVVISLDRNTELKQVAETVHYMRIRRGCGLKIVIRESEHYLRFLNELLLLRLGANLIIHQHVSPQRLPFLWELLAGQTYTRKIEENFDLAYDGILSSKYLGYVDLVTFCCECQDMIARGDALGIPFSLVVGTYHECASQPEILSQINMIREGDILSSSQTQCYVFMHACAEEDIAAAFSRVTGGKQDSLFSEISYLSNKAGIRDALQLIEQSGNIALAADFSEAIEQLKSSRTDMVLEQAAAEQAAAEQAAAEQVAEEQAAAEQVAAEQVAAEQAATEQAAAEQAAAGQAAAEQAAAGQAAAEQATAEQAVAEQVAAEQVAIEETIPCCVEETLCAGEIRMVCDEPADLQHDAADATNVAQGSLEIPPETRGETSELANVLNRLASQPPPKAKNTLFESMKWL